MMRALVSHQRGEVQRLAAGAGAGIDHPHPGRDLEERRDLLRGRILHLEQAFAKASQGENIPPLGQPQGVRLTLDRRGDHAFLGELGAQFGSRDAERVRAQEHIGLFVERLEHADPVLADFRRPTASIQSGSDARTAGETPSRRCCFSSPG